MREYLSGGVGGENPDPVAPVGTGCPEGGFVEVAAGREETQASRIHAQRLHERQQGRLVVGGDVAEQHRTAVAREAHPPTVDAG
jgi:hypothetical protein